MYSSKIWLIDNKKNAWEFRSGPFRGLHPSNKPRARVHPLKNNQWCSNRRRPSIRSNSVKCDRRVNYQMILKLDFSSMLILREIKRSIYNLIIRRSWMSRLSYRSGLKSDNLCIHIIRKCLCIMGKRTSESQELQGSSSRRSHKRRSLGWTARWPWKLEGSASVPYHKHQNQKQKVTT